MERASSSILGYQVSMAGQCLKEEYTQTGQWLKAWLLCEEDCKMRILEKRQVDRPMEGVQKCMNLCDSHQCSPENIHLGDYIQQPYYSSPTFFPLFGSHVFHSFHPYLGEF